MQRFDYVKYDEISERQQMVFKSQCQHLVAAMKTLPPGRAKEFAVAKLEEVYMWIGKAIRDGQLLRRPDAPLQEERKNG
jgi:hypothetical protein